MNANTFTAPFIGVLMLDTQFPRPLGDIGNPATFAQLGIPVRYKVVPKVWPSFVLSPASWEPVFDAFLTAAFQFQADGAAMVSASCGFLVLFQDRLAGALHIPVITSSLVRGSIKAPDERLGILTISAETLTADHLAAAGLPFDTPIAGVRVGSEFHKSVLENSPTMDLEQAKADVVEAALRLVKRCPEITTIILECTNMPPYADAIRRVTGRQVEHVIEHIHRAWHLKFTT
jgi:hypothetical protein